MRGVWCLGVSGCVLCCVVLSCGLVYRVRDVAAVSLVEGEVGGVEGVCWVHVYVCVRWWVW